MKLLGMHWFAALVLGGIEIAILAVYCLPLFFSRTVRRESRMELEGEDSITPKSTRRKSANCTTCPDMRCVCICGACLCASAPLREKGVSS